MIGSYGEFGKSLAKTLFVYVNVNHEPDRIALKRAIKRLRRIDHVLKEVCMFTPLNGMMDLCLNCKMPYQPYSLTDAQKRCKCHSCNKLTHCLFQECAIDLPVCSDCDEVLCDECAIECKECEVRVCDNCSKACPSCAEGPFCGAHKCCTECPTKKRKS